MSVVEITVIILLGGFLAGLLGALTGLGGGMIIVPLLAIGLGVNIRYAIGASLISIIATSSGAAAAYVREGFTNIRIGMFLEIATTIGALIGAFIAGLVSTSFIAIVFAAVLTYSAYASLRPRAEHITVDLSHPWSAALRLNGSYPTPDGEQAYGVQRIGTGFSLMLLAGTLSGLLGIGSGVVKVLAMDQAMRLPFKVSTTTSNFMIGVTAAASAGVYLRRGYIDPGLSFAVMLGVLGGAFVGSRLLTRTHPRRLRQIFAVVVILIAAEMVYKALTGRL
ncbi:MAG TPA: sulfite exporter TauE/SafE family protein [Gemmatimonadales bacterium]|jgi:hypothetical protein